MSADARAAVLGRIRGALADVPADEPVVAEPAAPGRAVAGLDRADAAAGSARPSLDVAARFVERVEDYRATVSRCAPDAVAAVVAEICDRHAATRVACPAGVPADWLPAGLDVRRDDPPLGVGALDALDGVVTGAAAGIAETGTILLDGGALSGRRALTLVPDLHVCVVAVADLVGSVPEGLAAVGAAAAAGRPITLVSGPSATSDIELSRVEGVHGPRRLEVVLVG